MDFGYEYSQSVYMIPSYYRRWYHISTEISAAEMLRQGLVHKTHISDAKTLHSV